MTSPQMPGAYNAAGVEQRIYQDWLSKGYFNAKIEKGEEPYVIIMPRPTSPGSCTWATPWKRPSRTRWSAGAA